MLRLSWNTQLPSYLMLQKFCFMVCSGHHNSLRLSPLLRVMNISPSQQITCFASMPNAFRILLSCELRLADMRTATT